MRAASPGRCSSFTCRSSITKETEGGHAAGASLREVADEQALEFTYLTRKLME